MLPLWIKALPVQKPRKNVHGWDPTTAEQTGKRWILIFQFDFLYSYYVSCIIKVKLLGTMLKIWYFNLVYQLNTQSSCPGTCSCTGHRLASSHQVGENPPWRPGVQAGGIPALHDWGTGRPAGWPCARVTESQFHMLVHCIFYFVTVRLLMLITCLFSEAFTVLTLCIP